MKETELRIGNWIIEDTTIYSYGTTKYEKQISLEDFRVRDDYWSDVWDMFKPIQLTEEWLLKFGFEKIVYDSEETGYGTDYHLKCNNDVFMCYSDDFSLGLFASEESMKNDLGVLPIWKNTNTVHGLQNLYFALIGEELTIK